MIKRIYKVIRGYHKFTITESDSGDFVVISKKETPVSPWVNTKRIFIPKEEFRSH